MLRSLKYKKLTIISHKTTDPQNTQHQFKPGLWLKYRFMIKYYIKHDLSQHDMWPLSRNSTPETSFPFKKHWVAEKVLYSV